MVSSTVDRTTLETKVKHMDTYQFLSKSARGATEQWGVKSVSLLARKA